MFYDYSRIKLEINNRKFGNPQIFGFKSQRNLKDN